MFFAKAPQEGGPQGEVNKNQWKNTKGIFIIWIWILQF